MGPLKLQGLYGAANSKLRGRKEDSAVDNRPLSRLEFGSIMLALVAFVFFNIFMFIIRYTALILPHLFSIWIVKDLPIIGDYSGSEDDPQITASRLFLWFLLGHLKCDSR